MAERGELVAICFVLVDRAGDVETGFAQSRDGFKYQFLAGLTMLEHDIV